MQIKNFDILDKGQKAYCVRTQNVFILKDNKLYSKYILCGLCTHTICLNQMFWYISIYGLNKSYISV